jgi:hypothetical protein
VPDDLTGGSLRNDAQPAMGAGERCLDREALSDAVLG